MLSELAIDNKEAFANLVVIAKDALDGKTYTPKTTKTKEVKETTKKTEAKKDTTKKVIKEKQEVVY